LPTLPWRALGGTLPEPSISPTIEDADIRAKFEYCKRAGIAVIVAGDPAPGTLPRIEKFVKEYDIRIAIHNHRPEDKLWPSPLDGLKAVKGMDPLSLGRPPVDPTLKARGCNAFCRSHSRSASTLKCRATLESPPRGLFAK
jgi:hypothetical protein